ncbi:MAG: TPM domain-containing protein [Actinomycetaceae bacterium]|nr:TPM domain-containing protein [Actinomycetaceae bacterium]
MSTQTKNHKSIRFALGTFLAATVACVGISLPAYAATTWIEDGANIIDDQIEATFNQQIAVLSEQYNLGLYVVTIDVGCDELDAKTEEWLDNSTTLDSDTNEDMIVGVAPACDEAMIWYLTSDDNPVFTKDYRMGDNPAGRHSSTSNMPVFLTALVGDVRNQAQTVHGDGPGTAGQESADNGESSEEPPSDEEDTQAPSIPGEKTLFADQANLFSASEKTAIEKELNRVSQEHKVDVGIFTLKQLEKGLSPAKQIDVLWERNQIGQGADKSGVIMLIVKGSRDLQFKTLGKGHAAITEEYGQDYFYNAVKNPLGDDDWFGGANKFMELSDAFLAKAAKGKPYSTWAPYIATFHIGIGAVIALLLGGGISGGLTYVFRGKHLTARKQVAAREYMRPGSFQLTQNQDMFLHSTTTSVYIEPKESSSSSSSSSSSGGGNWGGKF